MREDRESTRSEPEFWMREINSCIKRNQPEIDRYIRNVQKYRGFMENLTDPNATQGLLPHQTSLDNLHTFVTDASIAQMFFRNPRFAIRTPSGGSNGIFTPALARVETIALNDTIEQIGYFRRARRRLLDARNGPFGVLKITYDVDTVYDSEKIEDARMAAEAENAAFLAGDVKALSRAREDQLHSVYIAARENLLAILQRNQVPVPKSVTAHVKNSIKYHTAMLRSETPTETIRSANIVCRRVNPLDFFYDITVDDIADSRWFCHTYLMRKVDALTNDTFDKKAREEISESAERWVRPGFRDQGGLGKLSTGTFDNADTMVRVNEVTDLVSGKIRDFFEGGTMMAREREFTMRSVQPSGPYSILMFKPDPIEAAGISPPVAWEAEQDAATALQSAVVNAAIESSRPHGAFDKNTISAEEVERITHSATGEWFGLDLKPEDDIRRVMGPAPEIQISEQTVGIRSDLRSRISQSSGLGGQRALSGDKSGSATEAAITSGAAEAISEDQAAIHDDCVAYDGKMILRLNRKCKPKAQIVEDVGPIALQVYPEDKADGSTGFADKDIVNDRSCYVVPGSSRRRSTSVDAKLTMDGLTATAALPFMQSPTGASLVIEALRRWFEDQGISGLDWEAVDEEQKMQAMLMQQQAQMMMGGGGSVLPGPGSAPPPGGAPSGGPPQKRPSEMTEPSEAGQLQGTANVGGGRVATGASAGDQQRMMRTKAGVA